MPIRDEDLVRFLLGDSDPALREQVESALNESSEVACRLRELRAALGLLDSLKGEVEPPSDLVSRTLFRIDQDEAASADPSVRLRSSIAPTTAAFRSSRNLWDSTILTLSMIALSCLVLPVVLEARSQSRRLQCAHNLRMLGSSLTLWAMQDRERRFPSIPTSGAFAFAGVYGMRLNEAQLLDSPRHLKCASLPVGVSNCTQTLCIPSSVEFEAADAEQQADWREQLGGDYAYNLGIKMADQVLGPHLEGRAHFAIIGDAPIIQGDQEVFLAHDRRGANIFYEDGHVGFIQMRTLEASQPKSESWLHFIDHPFRNLQGDHEAGLVRDDAALGPSHLPPLHSLRPDR